MLKLLKILSRFVKLILPQHLPAAFDLHNPNRCAASCKNAAIPQLIPGCSFFCSRFMEMLFRQLR